MWRATLLADRCDRSQQAELEKQAKAEERAWNRKQIRRSRYLATKIIRLPAETVEQLLKFGQGVGFIFDCVEGMVKEVRSWGYLPPHVVAAGIPVCGCKPELASVRDNALVYTILINNLGCTPGVPAAVIEQWLEPANRPPALGDRPRHEVMGADPRECRERLLAVLEAERDRLGELEDRVRREVDYPSLREALDRVSVLSEEAARRLARSQAEARTTYHRAWKDLVSPRGSAREHGPLPEFAGDEDKDKDEDEEQTRRPLSSRSPRR